MIGPAADWYHSRLQSKLDELLKISPQTDAGQKLQRIIKKFRQNLFVFVTNRHIPPTNNTSEQALRPCAIFRKVNNCFRSVWGADLYAGIRSVIETARRRGIGILHAIHLTHHHQWRWSLPQPPCDGYGYGA